MGGLRAAVALSLKNRMELSGCQSGPRSSFRANSLVLQSWPLQLQSIAGLGYILCNIHFRQEKILDCEKQFQFGLNEAIIVLFYNTM